MFIRPEKRLLELEKEKVESRPLRIINTFYIKPYN